MCFALTVPFCLICVVQLRCIGAKETARVSQRGTTRRSRMGAVFRRGTWREPRADCLQRCERRRGRRLASPCVARIARQLRSIAEARRTRPGRSGPSSRAAHRRNPAALGRRQKRCLRGETCATAVFLQVVAAGGLFAECTSLADKTALRELGFR